MATLRRSSFLLGLAAAPLLVACGSDGGDEAPSPGEAPAGSDAFPVSLEHVYGTTEIPQKPARIVTIGWMTHDIVAALGVVPVAVPESWGGDEEGFNPWFRRQVEDVLGGEMPEILRQDDDGPDYEQILSLAPDLILAPHSGITEVQYERLAEIAPTLAYREGAWSSGTWQELTGIVATSLGESERGEELVTETETANAEAAEALPNLEGATFVYSLTLDSTSGGTEMAMYVPGDPRVSFLHEFGMVDTPALQPATEGLDANEFVTGVSLEELDTVEADVLVAWSNSADNTEYSLDHPVFSRWETIAGGHYYITDDPTMGMATSGPTVLSIPWALEQGYLEGISRALDGEGVVREAS